MVTIYKVFNPYTGLYSDASSPDELKELLAEQAWAAYLQLTNHHPIAIVSINDDGSQVWKSHKNEIMPNYDELRIALEKKRKQMIPITELGE
jgi:hypothetical protein